MKWLSLWFLFAVIFLFLFPQSMYAGNPPDKNNSRIDVSGNGSNQILAGGSQTATIVVTLQDSTPTPLNGDTVNLAAEGVSDSSVVFNPSSSTLDSSGKATFTMSSTNAQTYSIDVIDTTTGTTLSSLGQVTFVAPSPTITPTPKCDQTPPGSTPQLVSAVGNGSNAITLTWNESQDPVSYYLLDYGTSSGNYIYGNPNIGSKGTTSYTVGSLSSGVTYYFSIKAVYGCYTGNSSNEISAKTTSSDDTPTPTIDSSGTNDEPTDTISQDSPTDTPAPPSVTPTPVPQLRAGLFSKLNGKAKIIIGIGLIILLLCAAMLIDFQKLFAKIKKKFLKRGQLFEDDDQKEDEKDYQEDSEISSKE